MSFTHLFDTNGAAGRGRRILQNILKVGDLNMGQNMNSNSVVLFGQVSPDGRCSDQRALLLEVETGVLYAAVRADITRINKDAGVPGDRRLPGEGIISHLDGRNLLCLVKFGTPQEISKERWISFSLEQQKRIVDTINNLSDCAQPKTIPGHAGIRITREYVGGSSQGFGPGPRRKVFVNHLVFV